MRLDIDPSVKPDILASITDLSGVETESYDAVWSSHNIEHLFHYEAQRMTSQIRTVLKKSGWLIVTCPDIKAAMEHALRCGMDSPVYQSRMGPITARDILFGHQASIKGGNEYMAHKNGFDLQGLASVFRQSGFERFYGERKGMDLWFIAGNFKSTEEAKKQLINATQ